jgi:hypothetical protein
MVKEWFVYEYIQKFSKIRNLIEEIASALVIWVQKFSSTLLRFLPRFKIKKAKKKKKD